MKKVLYVIIGIVVLYIILAFIGPKHVKVERQIAINQPVSVVKQKLGDFRFFHDKWSPWTEKDPNMSTSYEGTPGEVGHQYSWKGNDDVGSGAMVLTGYNGDSLLQKLSFEGEGDAHTYFIMKDKNNATDVTWGMQFDIGFFRRPPMLFLNMDKMMGPDYEKGLNALKRELENTKPDETAQKKYTITEQQWPDVTYVGKKETVLFQNLPKFFGTNFPALYADLEKNKISPMSMPCAIFTSYDEKEAKADVIAAAKVAEGTKLKGWDKYNYDHGKVLHIAYYGAYEKSAPAHVQMDQYMKEKNLKQSVVIEEYVTDPGKEPDTSKWLTNIYYLVK